MGRAVFPPCSLTWGQTMVEVMKIMAATFKRTCACTATLSAPNPATGHCWLNLHQRFLDTHGQVWISLLWGHCSCLLSVAAHKVLFVSSKSVFPQSCVSSGCSMVGLMVTSSRSAYAIARSATPRAHAHASSPLLTHASIGDTHSKPCLVQSLWVLLVHTRLYLSPPIFSGGLGVWF